MISIANPTFRFAPCWAAGTASLRDYSGELNRFVRPPGRVQAENIEIVTKIEFIQLGGKLLARGT